MVFSHREKVVSNLARVVVVIWCIVVLILTQAYTASLTSLLTVQQLQPTVTDVKELIKRGDNVGYLKDSFVVGILKSLGFDEKKLVMYKSLEEWKELFEKGSENGGISAAFDEMPYVKLFLAKNCHKYTIVEPSFKTAGFGFAFPIGSPLVSDVSRAILNVTEGDKMKQIEDAWFKPNSCQDSSSPLSSNSLGLNSFWGLFLIAGIAAVSALLIFLVLFVYEHRDILLSSDSSDPNASIWTRILCLLKIYNQKDFNSHTFKNRELNLPSTGAPSPSSYLIQTDFPTEQGNSSPDFSHPSLNVQESRDSVVNIELLNLNPNQERPTSTEIIHENDRIAVCTI